MAIKRGKTGFRHRANTASRMYVRVVYCPDDKELAMPLYDPDSFFDKKSFAGTLMDSSYPSGMVVTLHYKQERRNFLVCNIMPMGPCLRQCDVHGFLISGGIMLRPCGPFTSPRLERTYGFH